MTPAEQDARGTADLLPCPFCGSEKVRLVPGYCRFVSCRQCGGEGPTTTCDKVGSANADAEATRLWNARDAALLSAREQGRKEGIADVRAEAVKLVQAEAAALAADLESRWPNLYVEGFDTIEAAEIIREHISRAHARGRAEGVADVERCSEIESLDLIERADRLEAAHAVLAAKLAAALVIRRESIDEIVLVSVAECEAVFTVRIKANLNLQEWNGLKETP